MHAAWVLLARFERVVGGPPLMTHGEWWAPVRENLQNESHRKHFATHLMGLPLPSLPSVPSISLLRSRTRGGAARSKLGTFIQNCAEVPSCTFK